MFDFLSKKSFRDAVVLQATKLNVESPKKIVFADTDDFILQAASMVKKRRIAQPVLLGDSSKLRASFSRLGLNNLNEENVLDYLFDGNKETLKSYADEYLLLRKADGKIISEKDALANMSKPHYYGAMMVRKGVACGMISGASSTTKPYFPVFEIIKLAPGVSRTSGLFIMESRGADKVYFFADCVMNMNPTSEQLAEIAVLSAKTCAGFELTPKVAMLSFSTRDSAKHDSVERVKLATAMVKRNNPDIIIDGEIQLDAALDSEVMKRKCPDSPLKGEANVLVFPDLNSANIGYKLVERLAGYEAIGPFLLGLRLPANDLSRGCTIEEVVHVAAVTVIQSKIAEAHKDIPGDKPLDSPHKHASKLSIKPNQSKPSSDSKYDPLDRLPSNVRKIIEESKKKVKKEEKD
jgi:phosphate acetyltransferase